MKVPTVKVRLKDGSECLINVSDFNGDVHERADAPKPKPAAPKAAPKPKPKAERVVPAKSQPKYRRR